MEEASNKLVLTGRQQSSVTFWGKGFPRMDIRNAAKIQQALGEKAIVDGFVNMPLKNYVDSNWVADVNQDVCKWTFDINEARWANDTTYKNVMWLKDDLKDLYAEEFSLSKKETDEMTFNDAYMYADAVYSERFEMIP